jgi:phage-related protein
MGFFSRKKVTLYESDLTRFMREFLEQHPEEVESQRKGRAIWWDKRPDERSPAPAMGHAPRSGGAEHTFGVDDSAGDDDDT